MKLIFICLFSMSILAQNYKPFQGKLVYSIEMADTSLAKLIQPKTMVIYTNDTIVRIENETAQLGKQIIIKHTLLNKSILLLENGEKKYAIQTDLSKVKTNQNDSLKQNLKYKKKIGKINFLDFKANRIELSMKGKSQTIEILYLKQFSPKYTDAFNELPGLPVRYYINTSDGVVVYTLIYVEKMIPNRDLFGVPSDFKKVSFDQFFNELMEEKRKNKN